KRQALWKNLGSWFNDRVANLILRKPRNIYMSPYKAIRREVADEIVKYGGAYPFVGGVIFTDAFNITPGPVRPHTPFSGCGKLQSAAIRGGLVKTGHRLFSNTSSHGDVSRWSDLPVLFSTRLLLRYRGIAIGTGTFWMAIRDRCNLVYRWNSANRHRYGGRVH